MQDQYYVAAMIWRLQNMTEADRRATDEQTGRMASAMAGPARGAARRVRALRQWLRVPATAALADECTAGQS